MLVAVDWLLARGWTLRYLAQDGTGYWVAHIGHPDFPPGANALTFISLPEARYRIIYQQNRRHPASSSDYGVEDFEDALTAVETYARRVREGRVWTRWPSAGGPGPLRAPGGLLTLSNPDNLPTTCSPP